MYDFDKIIPRKGTLCCKHDSLQEVFGKEDLTPLWVADMDFETPDFIVDALRRRLDHPIFGYPVTGSEYFETIAAWVKKLHGWEVSPSHIAYIPGIVKGIALFEHLYLKQGDKVVIQPPVYHPFRLTAQKQGFEVVYNPLVPVYTPDGTLRSYEMDLKGLEAICADPKVRILVLSNPHNPCGIAWSRETLIQVARIACAHEVVVISDEIHCEMMLEGSHIPFASVSREAAECSITFMAPSKTFNIAGIVSSYAIVQSDKLRELFFTWLDATEIDYANIFSRTATMAAYTRGDVWRREMIDYVRGNVEFVAGWLEANLPQIAAVRPQASFLVWLDCRKLGLSQPELVALFVDKAHLALNDGSMFGEEGTGFMRLNVGCPRSVLAGALESLAKAVKG